MLTTPTLPIGAEVRLISFGETALYYRRRLLSLGLTCGQRVSIVRKAPLGCPIEIDLRGTHLALRKEEASLLIWERL